MKWLLLDHDFYPGFPAFFLRLRCVPRAPTSRLLKAHPIRFYDELRLGSTRIIREGSRAYSEHVVAWLELGYILAYGFNSAGEISAQARVLA